MKLVVDASVAVKWFFEEDGHWPARALLESDDALIAPSIILAEIANATWKRFRRGEVSRDDAEAVTALMAAPFAEIAPIERIVGDAVRLSLDLDHPIYDCLYLALALRDKAPFLTADRKAWTAALGRGIDARLFGAGV
jgi:predicted nucleic acid-binding protein